MARKENRYTRFYTEGTAARQVEAKPEAPRRKIPKPRSTGDRALVIRVDPLALGAIVLAGVMLVMMVAGLFRLLDAKSAYQEAAASLAGLEMENEALEREYKAGYDLDEVANIARSMGLVPISQVETVAIRVESSGEIGEANLWQQIMDFFTGLFA